MAYNSKAIKTDVNAKPIPQYYNPVTDEYEVLQGVGGAARQVLYGPDGNPISTTEGKLAVRAAELEEKLEAVRVLLNALAGEDFATQTTLAQVLAKMIAAPATEAKQDALAEKIDGILDGTTPATTQLKGSLVEEAFEITPSDTADLTHETIAIYVGFDGDLKIDLVNGETITMYNLAAGAWHPIAAKKVYATGTTATYILGAYLI
jgi:hypothetical protein